MPDCELEGTDDEELFLRELEAFREEDVEATERQLGADDGAARGSTAAPDGINPPPSALQLLREQLLARDQRLDSLHDQLQVEKRSALSGRSRAWACVNPEEKSGQGQIALMPGRAWPLRAKALFHAGRKHLGNYSE